MSKRILLAAILIAALALVACDQSEERGSEGRPEGADAGRESPGLSEGANSNGADRGQANAEDGPGRAQGGNSGNGEPATANFDIRNGGAAALDAAWAEIGALEAGAPFKITMSESEMEAKLAETMEERGFGSNLTELDITFADQQIGVSFNLTLTEPVSVSVPASVLFDAAIDANGDLALEVASAEAGEVSIPPQMLDAISEAVAQAMLGARSSAEADVTLTDLYIDNGEMTIRGTVNAS